MIIYFSLWENLCAVKNYHFNAFSKGLSLSGKLNIIGQYEDYFAISPRKKPRTSWHLFKLGLKQCFESYLSICMKLASSSYHLWNVNHVPITALLPYSLIHTACL